MKKVNLYYIAILLVALGLIWLLTPESQADSSFYGFADNLETEINFHFPVLVEEILVKSGEEVDEGTPMIRLRRTQSKESPQLQSFETAKMQQEWQLWKQKKQAEIDAIRMEQSLTGDKLDREIAQTEREMKSVQKLGDTISWLRDMDATVSLREEREKLLEEKSMKMKAYDQQVAAIENELLLGTAPFRTALESIRAQSAFEARLDSQFVEIKAPVRGVIGDLQCRENEHIPAFKTLLTFYEPHPTIVRGFIHEDLHMEVQLNDVFLVSSLKLPDVVYPGKVIGMGSRIVEIPTRLRKFPQVKTYGREITLEIPSDNIFLQKEKVGLRIDLEKTREK